ncbi:ABC transporter ATP-binding protein [Phenylobacterium sp.]|uniref:ABC transporter ATP-binding protein n=1 Tax=Phenylobacterium sp. TaxID=1871053 RepID=UPI002FCBAF20
MSSDVLLRAEGVGKRYARPSQPWDALVRGVLGRPEPLGEWALRDISLAVSRGESVGVLGRNGAGKSTLLGCLSGAYRPTAGRVHVNGTVAAVLQLSGTFRSDLSARENLSVYFAASGLWGRQARAALDEAEAFAEIGKYFDMPVFSYSSGMLARAAFAGAISLHSDLMIIDEVLSVGDLAFRRKSAQAFQRLREQGRSFLLVSQNPASLLRSCGRGMVLDKGRLAYDGDMIGAAEAYAQIRAQWEAGRRHGAMALGPARTPSADGLHIEQVDHGTVGTGAAGAMEIAVTVAGGRAADRIEAVLNVSHARGVLVTRVHAVGEMRSDGRAELVFRLANRLVDGAYSAELLIASGHASARVSGGIRIDVATGSSAKGMIDLGLDVQPLIEDTDRRRSPPR